MSNSIMDRARQLMEDGEFDVGQELRVRHLLQVIDVNERVMAELVERRHELKVESNAASAEAQEAYQELLEMIPNVPGPHIG